MVRGQFHIFSTRSARHYTEKVVLQLEDLIRIRDDEITAKSRTGKLSPHERDELQFIEDSQFQKLHVGNARIDHFEDDEMNVLLNPLENVRDKDVYLLQAAYTTTSDLLLSQNVVETLIFTDALVRAKAASVTLVSLYYPYGRGDKQHAKDAITASLYARLLTEAGMKGLLTFDLHSDQVSGFFDPNKVRVEHLHASPLLLDYIKNNLNKGSVSAPDAGAAKRAQFYARQLNTDAVIAYKRRNYECQEIEELELLGTPERTLVFVVDDIISTGSTVQKVIDKIAQKKKTKAYVAATHPLLVNNAVEKLDQLYEDEEHPFQGLITTDSILHNDEVTSKPWYHQVGTSRFVAKAIYEIHTSGSLTQLHDPWCVEKLGLRADKPQ